VQAKYSGQHHLLLRRLKKKYCSSRNHASTTTGTTTGTIDRNACKNDRQKEFQGNRVSVPSSSAAAAAAAASQPPTSPAPSTIVCLPVQSAKERRRQARKAREKEKRDKIYKKSTILTLDGTMNKTMSSREVKDVGHWSVTTTRLKARIFVYSCKHPFVMLPQGCWAKQKSVRRDACAVGSISGTSPHEQEHEHNHSLASAQLEQQCQQEQQERQHVFSVELFTGGVNHSSSSLCRVSSCPLVPENLGHAPQPNSPQQIDSSLTMVPALRLGGTCSKEDISSNVDNKPLRPGMVTDVVLTPNEPVFVATFKDCPCAGRVMLFSEHADDEGPNNELAFVAIGWITGVQ
jgi:hypothetical protein